MNVDTFIDGLSAEAGEAVRGFLRQAYDCGFREALATSGQPAPPPIEEPVPQAPAPVASPVEWVPGSPGGADDESDAQGDGGVEDEDTAEALQVRPILPLATIGTLRRRIVRTFDLERFDIDVLICRSGDPERRQLRSTARLGLYRRGEQ